MRWGMVELRDQQQEGTEGLDKSTTTCRGGGDVTTHTRHTN